MNVRRSAMTLIEILVATALGMMIAGFSSVIVMHLYRTSARNVVRIALHDDAAVVARTLERAASACHPGGQWALESSRGVDGTWGTGDEWAQVTFLSAPSSRNQRSIGYPTEASGGTLWFRLRFDAAVHPERGTLRCSWGNAYMPDDVRSSSLTYTKAGGGTNTVTIRNSALPRRDRRRPLNDNDLRLLPGITATLYDQIALPGDGETLDAHLTSLLAPVTSAESCAFAWIDRAGRTVSWSPDVGVVVVDAAGATLPTPAGKAWWTAERFVCDGDFLDGRPHTPAGDVLSAGAQRPLLWRISFTLAESSRRDVPLAVGRLLRQDFAFSFPLAPEHPTR